MSGAGAGPCARANGTRPTNARFVTNPNLYLFLKCIAAFSLLRDKSIMFPDKPPSRAGCRHATILRLFLSLKRPVIIADKRRDFIRNSQQFFPLFAIEGDGEPAQAIYRKRAFFAYS